MKNNLVTINSRGAAFKKEIGYATYGAIGPTGPLPNKYKSKHTWKNTWQKRERL